MKEKILDMFDISGLLNTSVLVDAESIYIRGELEDPDCCPRCGESRLHRKTKHRRTLHLPPVGNKRAKLQVNVQKRACSSCQHY